MKALLLISITLVAMCNSHKAYSQIPAADSLGMVMIIDPADQTMGVGDLDFKANTSVIYKAVFILNDTITTAKFHVKLGSAAGLADYLNKSFLFDQNGAFGDGTAYERKGRVVYLSLGTYAGISSYVLNLNVENINGQMTSSLSTTHTN